MSYIENKIINQRYLIISLLGKGGMGETFKVKDLLSNEIKAVKILNINADEAIRAFKEEFNLLTKLEHPNLVKVMEFGKTEAEDYFYSMEFINGIDLKKYFELNNPEDDQFQTFYSIIAQILKALDYIHTRKIIHGDIKPSNILIAQDDKNQSLAKLLDFGFSEKSGPEDKKEFKGTAEYVSPERIKFERIDGRSDLYSLGILLYELLCRKLPFSETDLIGLLRHHLYTEVSNIPLQYNISVDFKKIIQRLLRKQVSNRYFSAYETLLDISKISDGKIKISESEQSADYSFTGGFFGREKEISELAGYYANLKHQSKIVFLTGESGIGKSGLLKEFGVKVQLESGKIIKIDCSNRYKKPFTPVFNAMKQLSGLIENSEFIKSNEIYEKLLSGDPELFLEKNPDLLSDPVNFNLLIIEFILEVSKQQMFVLAFDEFEKTDSSTNLFIEYLISSIIARKLPNILLVISFEKGVDPEFESLVKNYEKSNQTSLIHLESLKISEIQDYFNSALNIKEINKTVLERIYSLSNGNFGLLQEIITNFISAGIIFRQMGEWAIKSEFEYSLIPSSISESLQRKLKPINTEEKDFLSSLSVFASAFTMELIENILHYKKEDISSSLSKFISLDLLIEERNGYNFKDEKVRKILYDAYDTGRKNNIHSSIADYYLSIENLRKKNSDLLAYHLFNAKRFDESIPYLQASADIAKKYFANKEAEENYKNIIFAINSLDKDLSEKKYEILIKLHEVLDILGKRDEESEILEDLLILSGKINEESRLADIYILQAKYFSNLGEYEKSKKIARKALELKTKNKDIFGEGLALVNIGFNCLKLNHIDEFQSSYQRAIEIFKTLKKNIEYGNALVDLGIAYWMKLDTPQKAIEYYEEAYKIFDEINYERGKIRCLGNIGLAASTLGNYKESIKNYQSVLSICEKIGDRRGKSVAMVNLARALMADGKYVQALEMLNEGLIVIRSIKDFFTEEKYLENIGYIYGLFGKYDVALNYIGEALNISEKIQNRNGICVNLANIGLCFLNKLDPDNADKYLNRAEKLIDENIDYETEINVYIFRMLFFILSSNQENYEKAYQLTTRIIDLSKESSDVDNEVYALSYRGLLSLHLDKIQEALEHSTAAISIINVKNSLSFDVHEICYNHYQVLKANKDKENALEYLKKSYDIVMQRAEEITDINMKESYLENVISNREIITEYKKIFESSGTDSAGYIKIKNLETLYEISKSIISILDLDELLNKIMDLTLDTLNGERGLIFLLEEGNLTLRVARNVEKQTIIDASEISESIIKDVVKGGKPVITMDARDDERFKQRISVMNFQISALICVPIKLKDKILGTIYIDSPSGRDSIMAFTSIDLDFLEAFAGIVAISIENARLLSQLKDENIYLRQEVQEKFKFENIIGNGPAMLQVYKIMQGAINSDGTVLIQGDSGTGKELIARAIHYNSNRKKEKFIAVDCASLHETLLDSELFGHKKGSFTGAIQDKKGLFEEANGGTIFLDEITNTSLAFQAKLLRVLQEGEIRRVGDTESKFIDVRVISAANRNIELEVKENRFREDLFYRLNVIPIFVPKLMERKEDIPLLINHFIMKYESKNNKEIKSISPDLIQVFTDYSWPGNIRELENIINRMIIFADDNKLTVKDIPADFGKVLGNKTEILLTEKKVEKKNKISTITELEKEHILKTLEQTKGNKTVAAKILGLKRTTLVERMKKFGMM